MDRITAFFVSGTSILAEVKGCEDQPILEWLAKLSETCTYNPSQPGTRLDEAFQAALSRWELPLGRFERGGMSLSVYRYFPDWCLELRHPVSVFPDAEFSFQIDRLSGRFFAAPHHFVFSEQIPSDTSDYIQDSVGQNGRILRTRDDYTTSPQRFCQERTILVNTTDTQARSIVSACFVIEYDLRILRRDLHELHKLTMQAHSLEARVDTAVDELVRSTDATLRRPEASLTERAVDALVEELRQYRRSTRTYASDVFTAIHDMRDYCKDLEEIIGANSDLIRYYSDQASLGGTKCGLLVSPADAILERAEFLASLRLSDRPHGQCNSSNPPTTHPQPCRR